MAKRRIAPSLADQAERKLVMQAAEKARRGESLTQREQRALRNYEREKERDDRWRFYRTIPKRDWQELSGRPNKVLNEQADRYGIPLRGRTVDLVEIAHWCHDLLKEHGHKLQGSDDEAMAGPATPQLERWRKAKADIAEMDRDRLRGDLIPRAEIHEGHVRLAARLRQFGEILQQRFGPYAYALLKDLLEDYQNDVDRLSGDDRASDADV